MSRRRLALLVMLVLESMTVGACYEDDQMPPDVFVDYDSTGHFADGLNLVVSPDAGSLGLDAGDVGVDAVSGN